MKKSKSLLAAIVLLFGLSSFSPAGAQAQKAEFENVIINEFCDSFTKAAPRITKDNVSVEMGIMMLPLLTRYEAQIRKEWGVDVKTQEGMHAVGEKIGQLSALKCPAFVKFIKDNLQEIMADKEGEASKSYNGKILKIEGQPFVYLLVQNKQGRTDKLYWMEYFEGANNLSSQPTLYLNKPVTIAYKEMDVYQAADKEYKTIKVISRIEWK